MALFQNPRLTIFLMILLTIFFDKFIGRPKQTEQKSEYNFIPPLKWVGLIKDWSHLSSNAGKKVSSDISKTQGFQVSNKRFL